MAHANAKRRLTLRSDERHHCRSGGLGVSSQVSGRQPSDVEGLLARGRGQAHDVGVEAFQHATPEPVDGAVRLVDDARSNVSGGKAGVGDVVVQVRVVGVGDLIGQGLEDPLDGGDDDLGAAQYSGAGEFVDIVDLGEPATVIGGALVLELRECLVGQVVAVDQEQDPVEPAVLEQPVGRGHRRVGLACTGGHLH